MYRLHIANKNYSSWSLRPWLLMKTLSIPFEESLSVFGAGSNWDEFRHFSPSGLVPCLVKDDQVVWDSLAIMEYLAEQHQGVWPGDFHARTWARCASAEMHSGFLALRDQCPMNCAVTVLLNDVDEALQKDLDRLDELWFQGLQHFNGPFLAGKRFTAVDAFFAPVVFRINSYGLQLSEPAHAYVSHMLEIEGMQQWRNEALEESWIEPGHEQDSVQNGVLTADARKP